MKLNEKYNQDTFVDFINTFLPEDFQLKEEDIVIKKDRYKKITKAKILGFCESLDLYVLEMDHTNDKDPRVAIATDAFKILADHWIHRALIIFKNNDSENYRFSYLTITLDLNDKNKVTKKYSNARRYSFYLGANAKVKTPEQQLIDKGRIKDIDDLFNRFSVEVVNKQFYLEVAKFFDELVSTEDQNLVLPSVSESDLNTRKSFAVRLIGRTMFCWFLKQKKSDNGQLIPDELLSSRVVGEKYYHNILEPLFFGVLNTSIDSRDIRNDLFDKVPYLNGGLFNPQADDYYELDHVTFVSKYINNLRINDKWFKEFFELLETYNFTIDENTVFDQELSVDPEMLGRIFENLLAEINPETGSSERKRTGSFYTPRQIVEYMVDQSLVEYFKIKTDIDEKKLDAVVSYDLIDDMEYPLEKNEKIQIIDAIESLKILDPACGSGAYPIGVLQKIVYILQQVDPNCTLWLEKKLKGIPDLYKQRIINAVEQNPFDYTRKLDVIKNSIFGVDIQTIAVEVSRLRCFLTLVVETEIYDRKPNRGVEPLPNLDFKFVCANTLIVLPMSTNASLFDDHSGIMELSKIMSEYFSCNPQRKNELKIRFTNSQKEILKKTVSAFGQNTGDLTLKLTTWNPFSNQSNPWFDSEWMFGLQEKFDIVIGNPPYFVYQGHSKGEIETIKDIPIYDKSQGGKLNAFKLFLARGSDLLKNNGLLDFIFQNSFLADNGSKKIRQFFLNEQRIIHLDSFPERDNAQKRVFESVKMSVCIMLSKKTKVEEYSFNLCVWNDKNKKSGWSTSFTNKELLEYDPTAQQIPYLKVEEKDLFKKFFLRDDIAKIKCYEGELNVTFHKHLFTQNNNNPKIMKGAQIQRYYVTDDMSQGQLEYLDENKYLEANKGEKSTHHNFPRIAIQGISGVNDKIRIISSIVDPGRYLANSCNYIVKPLEGYSINATLGILNSKFINYIFKKTSTNSNVNTYEISNMSFIKKNNENIKIISGIENYVSEVLKIKSRDCNLNTKSIEEKIDELVMDLYGLTNGEKDIIRKS